VTKRFSRQHFYQVSYTFSRAENEQDDFGSAAQGADPFDFRRAIAANDVPHLFVANGTYIFPYDISFSGIVSLKSGLPVDPMAGTDLNGDGFTTDRPGTLARNSVRMPAFKSVDVTIAKALNLRGPHRIELRADVFNVLNRMNVLLVNPTYGLVVGRPSATFMAPTRVANPRQYQFAIRYRF